MTARAFAQSALLMTFALIAATACRAAPVSLPHAVPSSEPARVATAATASAAPSAAAAAQDASPPVAEAPLAALPVVWSHANHEREPALLATRAGPAVVAIEPGGHRAVLLDARTGAVRWSVDSPPETEWTHALAGHHDAQPMLLLVGYHPKGWALSRHDPESGAKRWQRTDAPGEVSLGDDGSGIATFSGGLCQHRLLDPANGHTIGPVIQGADIEMFGHGDMPPGHRCDHALQLHGIVKSMMITTHPSKPRASDLEAFNTSGTSVWKLGVGGRVHGVHLEGTDLFFATDYPRMLWRVNLGSGRVVWKTPLVGDEACGDKALYPRLRWGPSRGAGRTLLASSCNTAVLLDAPTGLPIWKRATNESAPVIAGLVPETEDDRELRFLDMPAKVQWVTAAGAPLGSASLGDDPAGVYVMREGVLVESHDYKTVSFFGTDGVKRWEHHGDYHGGSIKGDWFVMLAGPEPMQQILIEPSSGAMRLAAAGSPYVVGAVPAGSAGPALLVTARNHAKEVIAVRP